MGGVNHCMSPRKWKNVLEEFLDLQIRIVLVQFSEHETLHALLEGEIEKRRNAQRVNIHPKSDDFRHGEVPG